VNPVDLEENEISLQQTVALTLVQTIKNRGGYEA
jgi:hypothetical protein